MKKIYIPLLLLFVIVAALTEQGCDILNNLFLDQALKQTIETTGNNSDIQNSKPFCLSDYDAIDDNIDNIVSITYVSAAYFTESYSEGLTGQNIVATLYAGDGVTVIWQVTIPFGVASDYVNNPYEIVLTPEQVAAFNSYLANYENDDCYIAELIVQNVNDNDGPPFSLTGRVEIVVQMEIQP